MSTVRSIFVASPIRIVFAIFIPIAIESREWLMRCHREATRRIQSARRTFCSWRVLVAWFAFWMLTVLPARAGQEGDLTFQEIGGVISITGYTGSGGTLAIPAILAGKPVNIIDSYAFQDRASLTSVTIPNSVTMIGYRAFSHCTGLTNVTLPDSVTYIGSLAFQGCTGLTIMSLGTNVTVIGDYAFSGCTGVTSVDIPRSLTSIGEWAFSEFTGLTSVTIPDSVTSIGQGAFSDCTGLTSVTIANSVTTIGDSAFLGCASLTNVTLPNSITSIGSYAFHGIALATATIPKSVTLIGAGAFSGCSSLTGIKVDPLNVNYSSAEGVLFNRDQTALVQYPGGRIRSYALPSSVTAIAAAAFRDCTGLTAASIPDSVRSIGVQAFQGCTGLSSVTIPDSVATLGDWAFEGCTGVTNLTLGDGVGSIGEYAFSGCTRLSSVNLGKSVTPLGTGFYGCTALTSIRVDSLNPNYSSVDGVLFNKNETTLIEYAAGKLGTHYTIPESVTTISDSAFWDCTGLTSVTIPDSVTSIGMYAFQGCTGLSSVTIPDSVTTLGDWAFSGCTGLTSMSMGNRVTTLGDSAFEGCTGLTAITIPNSVTSISGSAFADCTGVTSVTLGNSLTNIGSFAFGRCSRLTSISVGPVNAAYSSLEGVLFNKNETTLIACPAGKVGNYTVGNSVTGIGYYAFYGCTGLTSVTIGNSVTTIGEYAFSGCTGLRSAYFLGDAPRVIIDRPFSSQPPFQDANGVTIFYRAGTSGWGSDFGGRPAVLWVAADDLDHDGMNNQEELLAATDPLDASSSLAFEDAPRPETLAEADQTPIPAGQHALYFQSIPGIRYEILFSETLGGEWTTVATVSATTSQKRVLLDKPALAAFYRIHVLPPQ